MDQYKHTRAAVGILVSGEACIRSKHDIVSVMFGMAKSAELCELRGERVSGSFDAKDDD